MSKKFFMLSGLLVCAASLNAQDGTKSSQAADNFNLGSMNTAQVRKNYGANQFAILGEIPESAICKVLAEDAAKRVKKRHQKSDANSSADQPAEKAPESSSWSIYSLYTSTANAVSSWFSWGSSSSK